MTFDSCTRYWLPKQRGECLPISIYRCFCAVCLSQFIYSSALFAWRRMSVNLWSVKKLFPFIIFYIYFLSLFLFSMDYLLSFQAYVASASHYEKCRASTFFYLILCHLQLPVKKQRWKSPKFYSSCSFGLVWLLSHGWKYCWLVWCERKILLIVW